MTQKKKSEEREEEDDWIHGRKEGKKKVYVERREMWAHSMEGWCVANILKIRKNYTLTHSVYSAWTS